MRWLRSTTRPLIGVLLVLMAVILLATGTLPTPAGASDNSIVVDSTGNVGYFTSITKGPDRFGLISYYDRTNRALKVAHCNGDFCSSPTITTLENGPGCCGFSGQYTSIAIGADGLGVISYYYYDPSAPLPGSLKVAHCNDTACTSATITAVDCCGLGTSSSLKIGPDGLPVISYGDFTDSTVKVAHCHDPACASASISVLGSSDKAWSSLTFVNGLPLVAYQFGSYPISEINVAYCVDLDCSSATTTTYTSQNQESSISAATGSDGLALIAFRSNVGADLKVLHCTNPACTSASQSAIDSASTVNVTVSLAIGSDGLGLISYSSVDWNTLDGDLMVAHCSNIACTSATTYTVDASTNVNDNLWAAANNSTTIGGDGHGLISYYDAGNGDLLVLHCRDTVCTGGDLLPTSTATATSVPQNSPTSTPTNTPDHGGPTSTNTNTPTGGGTPTFTSTPAPTGTRVTGTISGTVYKDSPDPGNVFEGVKVEVCRYSGSTVVSPCHVVRSDSSGHYAVEGLLPGSFRLRAFPPVGSAYMMRLLGPLAVIAGAEITQDIVMRPPTPPDTCTTITAYRKIGGTLPVTMWNIALHLVTCGCRNATGTYEMTQDGTVILGGTLTESPRGSGRYIANIAPVRPFHGDYHMSITLDCPDPNHGDEHHDFDGYIDPSGDVLTTVGDPIPGATVSLYNADDPGGPFQLVLDGDDKMSPANRTNPDTTDIEGHFGWDVLAGYYKVRAEKAGCVAGSDPSQPYAETGVLEIPPPVDDLELRLSCGAASPPTLNANGPYTVEEGGTVNLNAAGSDPNGLPLSYSWDLDEDGVCEASGPNVSYTAGDGPTSIPVKACVSDGLLSAVQETTIEVTNANPAATFAVSAPANEGEGNSINLSLLNPSDSSSADVAVGFTYSFDCGDGTGYGSPSTSNTAACPVSDSGSRTVRAKIIDKDGGFTEYTRVVTINNLPPAVASIIGAPIDPLLVGSSVSVSATFSDPGTADTHTVVWTWGDGTNSAGTVNESEGSGSVAGNHTYTAAGVYVLSVTVTDDEGASGAAEYRYIVVYDPDGGFITGGGWINSPAGAYRPNPALTGRSNFGFNSRYRPGRQIPDGTTEFNFQMSGLNFHSENYDWLVISRARAQYRGHGTINGQGNYDFILTAIDGQVGGGGGTDKLRMKIWDHASNQLVYDNQLNASDDADPTTVLSGGSIVIHR